MPCAADNGGGAEGRGGRPGGGKLGGGGGRPPYPLEVVLLGATYTVASTEAATLLKLNCALFWSVDDEDDKDEDEDDELVTGRTSVKLKEETPKLATSFAKRESSADVTFRVSSTVGSRYSNRSSMSTNFDMISTAATKYKEAGVRVAASLFGTLLITFGEVPVVPTSVFFSPSVDLGSEVEGTETETETETEAAAAVAVAAAGIGHSSISLEL